MSVQHADARPTQSGPGEWFTGTVYLNEIAETTPPSHLRAHVVNLLPGARTAWHTPPRSDPLRHPRRRARPARWRTSPGTAAR